MNEYSCNKENMELLCKELETTEESQIRNRLRTVNGFCCLGIATDLYRKSTGFGEWKKYKDGTSSFIFEEGAMKNLADTSLPRRVTLWLGIRETDDVLSLNPKQRTREELSGGTHSAIFCNDHLKLNFEQIALEIRKTYLPETLINLPA